MFLIDNDEFEEANKKFVKKNQEIIEKVSRLTKKTKVEYKDYKEQSEKAEDLKTLNLDLFDL